MATLPHVRVPLQSYVDLPAICGVLLKVLVLIPTGRWGAMPCSSLESGVNLPPDTLNCFFISMAVEPKAVTVPYDRAIERGSTIKRLLGKEWKERSTCYYYVMPRLMQIYLIINQTCRLTC
ncbi:hypothetical protein ANTQUA_LOCUS8294 [Anthophora quadrimaculata]